MADHLEQIEKQYYSIGEVAELLGVNTSLVRFWETEFPELKPKKNRKGNRVYRKEDVELLKQIHYLVKTKRYTLEGARNKLKSDRKSIETNQKTVETLNKLRDFLTDLKEQL